MKGLSKSHFDERSEAWQGSDNGQEFERWLEEWESFYPTEVDEFADNPTIEAFENLRVS